VWGNNSFLVVKERRFTLGCKGVRKIDLQKASRRGGPLEIQRSEEPGHGVVKAPTKERTEGSAEGGDYIKNPSLS